jgi:hypothetical protein
MEHKTTIVEVCPGCGSLDVRAAEPRWFAVDVQRRAEFAAPEAVERLELSCRECGLHWE